MIGENIMKLMEILEEFRKIFDNERDKGTAFEKLVKIYLENEPKYKSIIDKVWTWAEFPYRDNVGDTGIDLVAKTIDDEYWAIQCKFYAEEHEITKADVDTFLATSSKYFYVDGEKKRYSYRLFASTTNYYSKNAQDALENQDPPVGRIGLETLLESQIDWKEYSPFNNKVEFKEKKTPRKHQEEAITDVLNGFKDHDRGKLIMACGTGKTYTSLRIVEEQLNGKGNVLFLVPSIALASQTLTEWAAQCRYEFSAAVVCSDNKASKGDEAVDLGYPSTTDVKRLKEWANNSYKGNKDLKFIFSTYQSIEVVSRFQKETNFKFDIIVCDEAHRTTGIKLTDNDESYFVKVHDNEFIKADKRLYMTATPRIYGDVAKGKATEVNAMLCSMDDEKIYGPEFYKLGFGKAVKLDLLSDYKVLVLAVDEEYVKKELQELFKNENKELPLEDSVKIMGCWNGLSKISTWNEIGDFSTDPSPMKRAVAFCSRIKDSQKLVEMFRTIQSHVKENNNLNSQLDKLVNIDIKHVDGTFNALEKKERINWLKDEVDDGECRILTNARCLSEGVDVPALDAVIFLNPRNSMVDVIQSVGRVMRKAEGKKYGYVILPIGVSASNSPDETLDKNEKYRLVWEILQALRAHDDRFNNTINKIDLNKNKPKQIEVIGIGNKNSDEDNDDGYVKVKKRKTNELSGQIKMDFTTFDEWKESIYAKMVKKVGSKIYWENWAKDVAEIATSHMKKIKDVINSDSLEIKNEIQIFVESLRRNLNNSITEVDAIEMLSQHMITKPVFDALFDDYEFVKYNPVSKSMQKMIDILDKELDENEKKKLEQFHIDIKERAQGIDNAEGKQKIILELYEKFFKVALPKEVEKLGIVYTPNECVDFIIHSVEYLMNKEFNKSLSDKGIHIIDGFTGTGTFIVRLLQSGIIKFQDLIYKYTNDIHANEIVLLAYYIAAINIEATFHELINGKEYVPFEGIVLTDTFELYDKSDYYNNIILDSVLEQNNTRANKQKELPITVCIGNPPYSIGQKSANDDAANLHYANLDNDIACTYAKKSKANLKKGLYDNYIRAFKWATNRIEKDGIISFITNGAFIDNQGMDGFRKSLLDEFTSIYVFNLRGNARTSGEQRRKEKDNVFGQGTRTPIAITCLVKNSKKEKDNFIHYYDIGDYLSKSEKLNKIKEYKDVSNIVWKKITPDNNNDWVNLRDEDYLKYNAMGSKEKDEISFFENFAIGIVSSRDSWVYNFSRKELKNNMSNFINFYNKESSKLLKDSNYKLNMDTTKISWSAGLKGNSKRNEEIKYIDNNIITGLYRPFVKEFLYYDNKVIERPGRMKNIFNEDNLAIMVSGVGASKPFSALMVNNIPSLDTIEKGQCFPLYWYNINENDEKEKKTCISQAIIEKCSEKYKNTVTAEEIFYYVYAVLHSQEYKDKYVADLKKALPRIPLVEKYSLFKIYSNYGRKLSNLHLNYENEKKYKECELIIKKENYDVSKMKFGNNGKDKTIINYNDYIIIKNIPLKAYEYIVNGKSAIEWLMERYAITKDKNSNIINDPNKYFRNSKNILDLLLKVINVSVETMKIIESLPKLNFDE